MPVVLTALDVDAPWKIPQAVVPIFYIKALYDKAEALNVEKQVFLTLDVLSVLMGGVGLLTKLRYLRTLSTLGSVVLVAESVQIAAGTLGILLTFNEKYEKEHPQLRWLLILIELKAMGVSTVSSKMISQTAKEVVETAPAVVKADEAWPEVKKVLDEIAEGDYIVRGKYLGQLLDEVSFVKLKKYLTSLNVDFQIGKVNGIVKVDGYFYPSGRVFELKAENAALFITDGKKMKMVLRENATIYEMLHELMHFRHSQKLGLKDYYDLGKQANGTVLRERFVFDKLMEHSKYLNKDELLHAKRYMNRNYNIFGIDDKVEYMFDINKIPKKRQEINIDIILKLE